MSRIEIKYYQYALIAYLAKDERVRTQGWLEEKSGISQQIISNTLRGGFKHFSEKHFKILDSIGTDLISFLEDGRILYNDKKGITQLKSDLIKKHSRLLEDFPEADKGLELNEIAVNLAKIDPKEIHRAIDILAERLHYLELLRKQQEASEDAASGE